MGGCVLLHVWVCGVMGNYGIRVKNGRHLCVRVCARAGLFIIVVGGWGMCDSYPSLNAEPDM